LKLLEKIENGIHIVSSYLIIFFLTWLHSLSKQKARKCCYTISKFSWRHLKTKIHHTWKIKIDENSKDGENGSKNWESSQSRRPNLSRIEFGRDEEGCGQGWWAAQSADEKKNCLKSEDLSVHICVLSSRKKVSWFRVSISIEVY